MRLFAALRPPAFVLEHLDGALGPVRTGPGARLRWVPPEQLHLTIAFYGEVPDGAASDLLDALTEEVGRSGALELALRGAGTFSGQNLWVGVTGEVARLQELMRAAGRAPFRDDGALEARPPRPHLTVARVGRRARELDLRPMAAALAVYSGPAWRAGTIELISSRLGEGKGGGPLHEVIGVVGL